MKKILLIAITLLILIGTVGCASSAVDGEEKVFSSDGIKITLTDAFKKTSIENYTVCYDSKDVAVFVLQEKFDLLEGLSDYSIDDYGQASITVNTAAEGATLKKTDGLTYYDYTYENTEKNITYYYFTVLYKASDSFWMVQFATPEENKDDFTPKFIEWAKSVEFTD